MSLWKRFVTTHTRRPAIWPMKGVHIPHTVDRNGIVVFSPQDTIELLENERGEEIDVPKSSKDGLVYRSG